MGALQREAFPDETETPPTALPKGTLRLGMAHLMPPVLWVVNGVRHIPSAPNVRTEDAQIPLHNVGVTVPLG